MIVEGVCYERFRVTFRLKDGRRRQWMRWAPHAFAACESVRCEMESFAEGEVRNPIRIEPWPVVPGRSR